MKGLRSILAKLTVLAAVLSWTPQANAFSGYYSNGVGSNQACTNCHSTTVTTCNGCHAHGTHADTSKSSINIVASTSKTTYQPGESVTVTVTGGYRTGWVRVNLYDQNMVQLARSTCPSGIGGCTTSVLPATLTTTAPTTPGTYTWRAAWYGNAYDVGYVSPACGTPVSPPCFRVDSNNNAPGAVHGEEIVAVTQFTVASAAAPSIALSPASLSFGTVTVGGSVSLNVQVQNTGTAPLNVSSIALGAGSSSAFTWSPAAPFTVPAGGANTVAVTYTPTAASTDSGTLVFTSSDPVHPTVSLPLSGTGQAATAPSIAVAPTSLAFGNVVVGASGTQTFTVSNGGTATLTGTVALAAGTSSEFGVSPATFSIPAGGPPVTVTATYAPSGAGADSGAIDITSNDPGHPTVSVTVAGTGVAAPAPSIALTPSTLSFGNVVVGGTATLTTQVRNTGTLALVVSAIDRCAGTSTELAWTKAVPFTVDPGGSVAVDVTYAPTGLGADTGCIAFTSNDPSTPVADLAVSGTGVAQPVPIAAVSPAALDFGAVTIGSAASRTVTIQNTGTGPLNVTGISLASGTSSEFTWSPAAPFAVPAGGSATLTVTYKPTDGTADSGAVVIASDDPASPTIGVAVTGSGAQPSHSSGGCNGSGGSASWLALVALALLAAGRLARGRRAAG